VPGNPGAWLTTTASHKAVDRLADRLAGYHAYQATRADLLRRLGRGQESRAAYDKAIGLAGNTAEIAYLTRRRGQLG
jgi:RNA polymerase sigma-70 factor (ECF subfamily)